MKNPNFFLEWKSLKAEKSYKWQNFLIEHRAEKVFFYHLVKNEHCGLGYIIDIWSR